MSQEGEKQRLIKQMGSSDNAEALAAVTALREKGWLTDGSLRDAQLSGANLSNADLSGADLFGVHLNSAHLAFVDLSSADLRGADLRGANLVGAYLLDAALYGADLRDTDLRGADLHGANLRGADLRASNLHRTNMRDTDLSATNLPYARLFEANLHNTNLTESICDSTTFAGIDLSSVQGLETIMHLGPSEIGISTLYSSKGKIPRVFLQGCGVPEDVITIWIPSLIGKAIDFYSCFISYSHADKSFARRVHDTLQMRGIRCWLDEHQMLPGDDIYEEVSRGIRY